MKPASAIRSRHASARDPDGGWNDRAGRLFAEFEAPARAMVRRAFSTAFSADEIDDIYAGAWAGTLRALAARHRELSDDEIRSYVLAAVANQAGKELRRRRRKPTAPLELVGGVPDVTDGPEERATSRERARVTRDLLASLPPRRRAVMLLRYGWGLQPRQVCELVAGLSPRAYRKEITRGVEQLTERMRALERGEWCADREPVLEAYAAGVADAEQRRQATAHLAHCRRCADFVARLSAQLHDLGGAVAASGAIAALGERASVGERLLDLGERARDAATGLLSRAPGPAEESAGALLAAGGGRGAGVAGAGVIAKLAGIGAAGKLAVACIGAAAIVPCVGALTGGPGGGDDRGPAKPAPERKRARPLAPPAVLPTQVEGEAPAGAQPPVAAQGEPRPPAGGSAEQAPAPQETDPVPVEEAPASDFSFGAETAAAPAPAAPAPGGTAGGGGSDSGGGGAPSGGDFTFGSQ